MKSIRLENITKTYNGQVILKNLYLTIPAGQFFALLGPSGSGKTTILRLIAGFERPDSGRIFLGDEDITDLPINKRQIHTVFQSYALFPHLNVFENVAYSQRIKGLDRATIEQKVMRALIATQLENYAYHAIDQLSGGQKQRVALARALINEPAVLLLDEPLAALDLKLREKILVELIDLQDKLQTTFLYVTHDQFEALTVADKMAIMNPHGSIEQIGTPKEIYEFPASTFVAKFVGTTNIIKGTLRFQNNEPFLETKDLDPIKVWFEEKKDWMFEGNKVALSIRPEKILMSVKEVEGFANHAVGVVESIVYHGRSTQYNVRLSQDLLIQVFEQNEEHFVKDVFDYNTRVHIYWQKENAVVLKQ